MDDIAPVVTSLRTVARMSPALLTGYFTFQFMAIGALWGTLGCIAGGGCGFVLGSLISYLIAPVYLWLIHTLFLMHGIREHQRRIRSELES